MNIKQIGVIAFITVVVSLAVVFIFGRTVINKVTQQLPDSPPVGAIPGNSIDGPEFSTAGAIQFGKTMNFTSATSSVCVIQGPAASTTLVSFGSTIDLASSTDGTNITLGYNTTAGAVTTSTPFFSAALAAGTKGSYLYDYARASTTANPTDGIFPPNSRFVVGIQGDNGNTNASIDMRNLTPLGECTLWLNYLQ